MSSNETPPAGENIGLQIKGIEFTQKALSLRPAHAALLAEILAQFSLIEGTIGGIYGLLRHEDIEGAIEELEKLHSNNLRLEAVRKQIKTNAELAAEAENDALMLNVKNYAEMRNKIAHGLWGHTPATPEYIYRLPLKKTINFSFCIHKHLDEGNLDQEMNKLYSIVEKYNVAELQTVLDEGKELLLQVMLLFLRLSAAATKAPVGKA